MRYAYDFHIHTALSPCGDDYMTPHNIVNMCKLNNLDIIAITDHNTLSNCEAVIEVGKANDLLVIPGMEIECMEEFHNIALFPSLEMGEKVAKAVKEHMLPIKNKVAIFGHQCLLSSEDEVIGEEENLLVTACQLSVKELYDLVEQVGGIIYPAHIDRSSYSILSNLGSIPEDMGVTMIEVSFAVDIEDYRRKYPQYKIIQSSDAHYLENLCVANHSLELSSLSCEAVFEKLMSKN